jgi:hypothetical protein
MPAPPDLPGQCAACLIITDDLAGSLCRDRDACEDRQPPLCKETAEGSRLGQDGVVSGFLDVQQGDIIHVTRGDRSGDVRVTKVTPGGGHSVTIETEPLAGPDPGLPIPNDDPRCHCALEPDRPVADGMTVIDIAEGRAALHSDCPHHGPVARQMLRAVMPGNSFSVAPGAAQARLDP